MGGEATIMIDIMVGIVTGVVGGLFFRLDGRDYCLTAIFLGTLYWFFYGTAFVIGLLEIIAGELETGVTRFIAVSVKTFVLSLGAGIGLLLTASGREEWLEQTNHCGTIDLDAKWWRIPLYLLCSGTLLPYSTLRCMHASVSHQPLVVFAASALGQYRFPIVGYWRSLIVQLVGYEVQYQMFKFLDRYHPQVSMNVSSKWHRTHDVAISRRTTWTPRFPTSLVLLQPSSSLATCLM